MCRVPCTCCVPCMCCVPCAMCDVLCAVYYWNHKQDVWWSERCDVASEYVTPEYSEVSPGVHPYKDHPLWLTIPIAGDPSRCLAVPPRLLGMSHCMISYSMGCKTIEYI